MSKWSFKKQLQVGNKGESLFLEFYHSPINKLREYKADFIRLTDGKLVELKTDTYSMDKTPYFFIERWSDIEKKKPGSVWQSSKKGVGVFCYMFINDRTYFEFSDLPALLRELDKLTQDMYLIRIPNKGWTSGGYKVPREALKHLYKEYSF